MYYTLDKIQVIRTKLGLPNFQGLPFDSFEEETEKFRSKWKALMEYYRRNIQRGLSRNREKVQPFIDKLRNEKMLCPYEYPKLTSQIAPHPPRLPKKPTSQPPRLPSKPT